MEKLSFFKNASLGLLVLTLSACTQFLSEGNNAESPPEAADVADAAPPKAAPSKATDAAPSKATDAAPPKAADAAPAEKAPQVQADNSPLKPLAWLEGCWKGSVNKRDYQEHWLPLRGDMMLGASHTVVGEKTQDYQFLRMEIREDEVHYVIAAPDEKEQRFKFVSETEEDGDTVFTFNNVNDVYPELVSYRKASAGWMYITVNGKINGTERKVIYPIRRIDCGSGEFLTQ